jgi:hypothetical protein
VAVVLPHLEKGLQYNCNPNKAIIINLGINNIGILIILMGRIYIKLRNLTQGEKNPLNLGKRRGLLPTRNPESGF